MQEHIEAASLRIVDNAGHVSILEQPDELNTYLSDFLNFVSD
jgi:pimeloyl-ACP methyl ester carboxylesterase